MGKRKDEVEQGKKITSLRMGRGCIFQLGSCCCAIVIVDFIEFHDDLILQMNLLCLNEY
jgi:hypothetical protein